MISEIHDFHQLLKTTVTENFDQRVAFMTDSCMATMAAPMLKDLSNPIGLNLVDGPASAKTTVLSFFYHLPWTVKIDDFSPASFVTQAAGARKKNLAEIDLLPKIKDKTIIIPELAPVFGESKEVVLRNMSLLTRIFDGQGLTRAGGVHGLRAYEGEFMFAWLAATTPIRPTIWNLMGNLGSRWMFLTANTTNQAAQEIGQIKNGFLSDENYDAKINNVREIMQDFWKGLLGFYNTDKPVKCVQWNKKKDNQQIFNRLVDLAGFCCQARSTMSVWKTFEYQHQDEVDFTTPIIEHPWRLATIMYALARGHAIINGRQEITEEDLPLIAEVAFSSMPDDRRKIVDELIKNNGTVYSDKLEEQCGFSRHTILKLMNALKILNIGELNKGAGSFPASLSLKTEYDWLLSDEIKNLRRIWDEKRVCEKNTITTDEYGLPF